MLTCCRERQKTRGKSVERAPRAKKRRDFNERFDLHTGEVQGSIPCAPTTKALVLLEFLPF